MAPGCPPAATKRALMPSAVWSAGPAPCTATGMLLPSATTSSASAPTTSGSSAGCARSAALTGWQPSG
eukprot:2059157-Pyramimonas_sp.AAC.1